jgi:hypothetical protein
MGRSLEFLKAGEPGIRWRVVLAMNKAYPEFYAKQREKAVSVLTELIKDEDIFVKVRAYEAFLNIMSLEKKESDFVRQWVLYNFEQE